MKNIDRYRGCLIGGAVGDALGYAVEFLPDDQIFLRYGEKGITQYDLQRGVAEISDDTQMSMFTATGLLVGTTRGMTRGIMGKYTTYIADSYREWYQTQCKQSPSSDTHYHSWLASLPEMYSSRAPGNTCLAALEQGGNGTIENPINHSKGCGGIMRVAPIGLYLDADKCSIGQCDMIGAEAAAITHGHELGYIPAAMLVHIVRLLSHDETQTVLSAVHDAIATIPRLFPGAKHTDTLQKLLEMAIELSSQGLDDLDAIRELGQGWVAEETLAIAVYCALKYHDDFEGAMIAAVNHSGDSDSTGAVTGNILGAYLGYTAIPQKYLDHLELHDTILELADDLFNDCQIAEYSSSSDEKWERKYIR